MSIIPSNLPAQPPVDYSSRDYASLLTDMVNLIPYYLPAWRDRSKGNFGMALLELFSYVGDNNNYYIDRVANECFLPTAQQMQSIFSIAKLLNYTPSSTVAASVTLQFTLPNPSSAVFIPAGTQVSTQSSNSSSAVVFETTQDLTIWGTQGSGTTQTQTANGQANQLVILTGPFDGSTASVTVNNVAWTAVSSFIGQTSTASVYVISNNEINFGNGTNGAIPPLGAAIQVQYFPFNGNQFQATVTATQGTSVNSQSLGLSSGQPNQTFQLFASPVINNSVQIYVDEGTGPTLWVQTSQLAAVSPSSTSYTLSINQNGVATVTFGDGVNGRAPISGAAITTTYQVGGGSAGNVAANSLTAMVSNIVGIQSVTNPAAASGGADAETASQIRSKAPVTFAAQDRGVTPQDFAALAMQIPGIALASSQALYLTSVSLFVHPVGGFISDFGVLQQRVSALAPQLTNTNGTGYLDTRKMAYTSVTVLPPQYFNTVTQQVSIGYVPVDITIEIAVLPQFFQSNVTSQVQSAIAGLFNFDNINFGYRITLSSVYHTVQMVSGVDYCNIQFMCRAEISPQTLGDVVCAPYEIPILGVLNIGAIGGISQ